MAKPEPFSNCTGLSVATPVEIYNRPGLKAVAYRTGNYYQFRDSLFAKLSTGNLPALKELTTRSDQDFTIALLDAWAVTAEVLTFYQERIANESYLATATERHSITELAKLIGYELRPGLAAGTYVAFSLDENSLGQTQALTTGIPRGKEEKPLITIEPGIKIQSIPGPEEQPQTFETTQPITAKAEWNAIKPLMYKPQQDIKNDMELIIQGVNNQLKVGDILLINRRFIRKILQVELDTEQNSTKLVVSPQESTPPENLPEEVETVEVFRTTAFVFGYTTRGKVSYSSEGEMSEDPWKIAADEFEGTIFLDNAYPAIKAGSYVAVQVPAEEENQQHLAPVHYEIFRIKETHIRPRTAYGFSNTATYVTLEDPNKRWGNKGAGGALPFAVVQNRVIFGQNEALALAGRPLIDLVKGKQVALSKLYPDLKKGKVIVVSGELENTPGVYAGEVRQIEQITMVDGLYTALELNLALDHEYIRSTVRINANVAEASHGETVHEILGSGNAGQSFQKFVLKQPPLTYTSAATASGATSSLEIRVNDIRWKEVPSLYGRGPNERVYTSRQDGNGQTTITFGDGITGARLPTGQQNVRAIYRKGTGLQGLQKAHQLSQLLTRPLEVKGVTNPVPSSGAQNQEVIADARRNAILPIFTLNRIVSLQDYEDFARAFLGIAKAKATWAWRGQKRLIHITIAGYDGVVIAKQSSLYKHLVTAIKDAGIPGVSVLIDSYQPATFNVTASIKVLADYLSNEILAQIEAQLRQHFSFTQRDFGQAVIPSEVVSTIQSVEGVLMVDLDSMFRTDDLGLDGGTIIEKVNDPLTAHLARPNPDQDKEPYVLPAELLTIDKEPLEIAIA